MKKILALSYCTQRKMWIFDHKIIITLSVSFGISSSLGRYFVGTSSGFLGSLIGLVNPPIETLLSFCLPSWKVEHGRTSKRFRTTIRLNERVADKLDTILDQGCSKLDNTIFTVLNLLSTHILTFNHRVKLVNVYFLEV